PAGRTVAKEQETRTAGVRRSITRRNRNRSFRRHDRLWVHRSPSKTPKRSTKMTPLASRRYAWGSRGDVWRRSALDHTAGDPRARVPRRVGLFIVRVGVDDQRGAARPKDRVRAFLQRHQRVDRVEGARSISSHLEVREISRMGTVGIRQTVMLPVRIEVGTRRHEVRGLTLPDRVNVKPVLA